MIEKIDWKEVLAGTLRNLLSDNHVYNAIRYKDADPEKDAKLEISEGFGIPFDAVERIWCDDKLFTKDWQQYVGINETEEEIITFYLRSYTESIACMHNHAGNAQRTMIAIVLSLIQKMEEILCRRVKILDYGGGAGTLTILLKKFGFNVDYYDIGGRVNEFAKWRFKKRALEIKACCAYDYINPSLVSKDYDVVIALEVLEHVFDVPETLKYICSLVRDDGFLVFSESCADTCPPVHLDKNRIFAGAAVVEMTKNLGFEHIDSCTLMPFKDGCVVEYLIGILKIFRQRNILNLGG